MTDEDRRRRVARAGLARLGLVVLLLVVPACSSGGGDGVDGDDEPGVAAGASTTTTTEAADRPARLRTGPLAPGEHEVDLGDIEVRFTVGEGWESRTSTNEYGELYRGPSRDDTTPAITFTVPGRGSSDDFSAEALLPRITAAGGTVSNQADVTVSGLPMKRVDVSGTGDVTLFAIGTNRAVTPAGTRSTLWIGEVEGQDVLIMLGAPADRHEAFKAEAEEVLQTVRLART